MAASQSPFDTDKFIDIHQVGGIDACTIDEGPGRGVRALYVNSGGGLRYRVLVDRGLDIDQAFFNQHSLTYLSHKGVTPPARALDRGLDWLKGFPGGLLTSCGPFNTGAPVVDEGESLGLHGPHSNTAATIESIIQPNPRSGRMGMSITGTVRYGALFGPCVELRRTIVTTLGDNAIEFTDQFFNAGNEDVPHAWLLHINFGYPLADAGAEFCYDARPEDAPEVPPGRRLPRGRNVKRIPAPLEEHHGRNEWFGYLYPRPLDRAGSTRIGIVNRRLSLGAAIDYSTKEFPRCGNWQHWGRHEYVCALEPMTGGVEGRDKDRARRWLTTLPAGGRKTYRYRIEVITDRAGLDELRQLNQR